MDVIRQDEVFRHLVLKEISKCEFLSASITGLPNDVIEFSVQARESKGGWLSNERTDLRALKAFMIAGRWTQRGLAKEMGIATSSMSSVVNGKRPMNVSIIAKLVELGMSPFDLLNGRQHDAKQGD